MKRPIKVILLLLSTLLMVLSLALPFVTPVSNTLEYYGIIKEKEYEDYAAAASMDCSEIVSIINYYLEENCPTEEVLSKDKNLWIWKDENYHLQIVSNKNNIFYSLTDLFDEREYRFTCRNDSARLFDKEECVIALLRRMSLI